jgi:hypothetical protein
MNSRHCTAHTHRGTSRAHRLLLACHALDDDARHLVIAEHGECVDCWRDTCLALADAAHSLLIGSAGVPELDPAGNVGGPSVDRLLRRIDAALVCEQADRGRRFGLSGP